MLCKLWFWAIQIKSDLIWFDLMANSAGATFDLSIHRILSLKSPSSSRDSLLNVKRTFLFFLVNSNLHFETLSWCHCWSVSSSIAESLILILTEASEACISKSSLLLTFLEFYIITWHWISKLRDWKMSITGFFLHLICISLVKFIRWCLRSFTLLHNDKQVLFQEYVNILSCVQFSFDIILINILLM